MTERSSFDRPIAQPDQEALLKDMSVAQKLPTDEMLALMRLRDFAAWEGDDPETARICQAELNGLLGIIEQ